MEDDLESNAKQGISDQAKAESFTMCVDKAKLLLTRFDNEAKF